jgi:hypothetical protein
MNFFVFFPFTIWEGKGNPVFLNWQINLRKKIKRYPAEVCHGHGKAGNGVRILCNEASENIHFVRIKSYA